MTQRKADVQVAWGIGAQVVTSLTNAALGLIAVHTLDRSDFGILGSLMAGLMITLRIQRVVFVEPVLLWPANSAAPSLAASARSGKRLLAGFVPLAVVAGVLTGSLSVSVAALALIAAMAEDLLRQLLLADGKARVALLGDVAWLIGAALALGGYLALGEPTVAGLVTCWGLGAAAGLVVVTVLVGDLAHGTRHGDQWIRPVVPLLKWTALDGVASVLASSGLIILAASLSSSVVAGELRATQQALMPVGVFLLGAQVPVQRKARTNWLREGPWTGIRALVALPVAAGALSVACTSVLLVSSGARTALLGSFADDARDLLLLQAGVVALSAASVALGTGLYLVGASRVSAVLRAIVTAIQGLTIGVLGSGQSAQWYLGLSLATTLALIIVGMICLWIAIEHQVRPLQP